MTEQFNPLANLDALVNEALEVQDIDMTETGAGGYEKIILPKGTYNLRFIEYIEVGKRIPTHNNKPTGKPAVLNARVGFAIYGPNGEVVYNRPFPMGVYNSEKAKFKILFDRLNAKGDIKHIAQKLSQAFRAEVTVEKNKQGKEYNAINFATLQALPKFDPETGEPIKIPDVDPKEIKLFLWAKPTQPTWDSLYIDGQNDKGESKNFIQNDILQAADYVGSPLQALLEGSVPSPESLAPSAPSAPSAPVEDDGQPPFDVDAPTAPTAPVAPTAPQAPTAPVAPTA